MARRLVLALAAALPVAFATAAAQANAPTAPPAARVEYALTNVRIVIAPGRVIDRGTVLTHEWPRCGDWLVRRGRGCTRITEDER